MKKKKMFEENMFQLNFENIAINLENFAINLALSYYFKILFF